MFQNINFIRSYTSVLLNINNLKFVFFKTYATMSNGLKPFDSIPGLSSLPFLGPIHHFMPVIGSIGPSANFFDLAQYLHKKFGSIVRLDGIFARANMVLLYKPEDFDQVYRSEEMLPLRPGFDTLIYYQEELRKNRYNNILGLTSAQGQKWREIRTKVNPVLLKPQLVKLYTPTLEEISKEMTERLLKLKDQEHYLQSNFDSEITKWSLESVAYIALGTRLGCLNDEKNNKKAQLLIACASNIMDLAYKLEFFPSPWRYFETPNLKKMIKILDLQWEISEGYIEMAKKDINERKHNIAEEEKSIIEKLLAIDDKVAIMITNEMLLAGIDTVAYTTIGLLYNLAINPEVQKKLRKELSSKQPSKYLKACLKESLRLYPVLPANLRRTTKEHVVAGYCIPKGVDVIAPNEFLSKLDCNYPWAMEFLPERWLVEKSDTIHYGKAHPMTTLPFGFGVRSCIGRRIAEIEIETLIKILLYDLKVNWNGPPLKVVTKVINKFEKPYHFKFQKL